MPHGRAGDSVDDDDVFDQLVESLNELISGIGGTPAVPPGGGGPNLNRLGTDFVPPSDLVTIANDRWENDDIEDVSFDGDLEPGDEEVVVEVQSTDRNNLLAVKSIFTSVHPGDIDGDGVDENIVRYRLEHKQAVGDTYATLPGMETTLPFGQVGQFEELIKGAYVGPMTSFRIVLENRSDEYANPITVPEAKLAGGVQAKVIRGVGGD